MDLHELTSRVIEHGEKISAHDEEIKTLFNQQKNIEKLATTTQELALSMKELTAHMCGVEDRLEIIEGEKRQKGFAIWQIVVSAIVGGAVTYLATSLF